MSGSGVVILPQMVNYSLHVGHSLLNSLFMAAWLFFGFRQAIWFINLLKTLFVIKLSFRIVKLIISNFSPFWVVNIEPTTEYIIKEVGSSMGEFSISSY